MHAWEFSKLQYTAKLHHFTPFVSMQNMYNLLYREEEREMVPLLKDMDVAMTPWSPLARGKLAKAPGVTSQRDQQDALIQKYYQEREDDLEIIDRVGQLALKKASHGRKSH